MSDYEIALDILTPALEGRAIYLSGPISGRVLGNRPLFFAVENALRPCNPLSIRNPHRIPWPPHLHKKRECPKSQDEIWQYFMRRAVRQLTYSHVIVQLPDWMSSRGARREHILAKDFGMEIIDLNKKVKVTNVK